jgi:cytoskeleton protein RodZ
MSQAEVPSVPEPDEPRAPDSPGAQLMAERRNQGLSLGDIARQLKLSVRQIEALERDDYASFSGPLFARGFLRNYAKLLHLDPEPMIQAANLAIAPAAVAAAVPVYAPVSAGNPEARRKVVAWISFAVLAVLVVVLLASHVSKDHRDASSPDGDAAPALQGSPPPVAMTQHPESPPASMPQTPPAAAPSIAAAPAHVAPSPEPNPAVAPAPAVAAASSLPVAAPKASPPAPADAAHADATAPPGTPAKRQTFVSGSGSSHIRMSFEDESWVEIKDGSGTTIFSRLNAPGTERIIRGAPPFTVVVGNAHGVKLIYQDKPVDLGPHTRVDVARVTLE